MRSPWRLAAAASAGVLLLPLAVGLPLADAAPKPPLRAPQASPAVPLAGERVVVTGAVPGATKRAVVLQRRVGTTWVAAHRGTTTASGRYAFTVRPRTYEAIRVLAPATRRLPVRSTSTLRLNPVPTTAAVQLTGTRLTTTATATVTPVRPGRILRLQTWTPGDATWRTVQLEKQTGKSQTWVLHDLPAGTTRYRVLAAPWNGARQHASAHIDVTPPAIATSLPRISLVTENAAPVTSRDTYVPGTLQVDADSPQPMEIKGRGNSTWNAPKKPYRIKLGTKASLLGLPSEKDWVLLADYSDRSKLRNWTAFELARRTSMAWTPQSRFVQVTLNSEDLGLYQLVEQVEESSAKVQLADGGLLLEIDQRGPTNDDPGFTTARGLPISFKDPDDPEPAVAGAVKALVDEFESVLYSADYLDPADGYAQYLDLTSFADWYLISEAMKSLDSDFFSSIFLTWDPAGTLRMGPVWDFDLSSGYTSAVPGCCEETSGWWLRPDDAAAAVRGGWHNNHWLARMTTDPAFVALLELRWTNSVKPALDEVRAGLAAKADELGGDAEFDWVTWKYSGAPMKGAVHAADHAGEVSYFEDWLAARSAWMDAELS